MKILPILTFKFVELKDLEGGGISLTISISHTFKIWLGVKMVLRPGFHQILLVN